MTDTSDQQVEFLQCRMILNENDKKKCFITLKKK
ncbi:unnamed protein product, partial [Rotaria magnacalcarata]